MVKAERLDVRLSADEDHLIRRAASAQGMSVSAFVVWSAWRAAQQVLAERVHFFLDETAWADLQARLSRPPVGKPALMELLAEPDPFL